MAASNQPWQGMNIQPAAAWFGDESQAARGAPPSPMWKQPWDATQAPWAGFNMDAASRDAVFAAISQIAGLPQADPRMAAPQGGGHTQGPPGAHAVNAAQDALRKLESAEQDVLAHQQRVAIHERAAQEAQAKLAEARKHLSSLGFSGPSAAASASAGWPAAVTWSGAQEASPRAARGAQLPGNANWPHAQAQTEAYAAAAEAAEDLLPADSASGEGDAEASGQGRPGAPARQGEAESEAEVGQDIEDAVAAFLAGEPDDEGSDDDEEDARLRPARRQLAEPRPAERETPIASQPWKTLPEPQPAIPRYLVTPPVSAAKQPWSPPPAEQHQQPGSAHAQAQKLHIFGSRETGMATTPGQSPHPQQGQFAAPQPDWAAAVAAGDPLLGSNSRQQALLRWGELCGAGVASVGALVHRFNRSFSKSLPSAEFIGFSVGVAANVQGQMSEVRWAAYVQAQQQQQPQQQQKFQMPIGKPPGLESSAPGMDGDAKPFVPMAASSSPSSSAARVAPSTSTSRPTDKDAARGARLFGYAWQRHAQADAEAALKAKAKAQAAPQTASAKSSSQATAPQHAASVQATLQSTPQTHSLTEIEAGELSGDESSGDEGLGPVAQSVPIGPIGKLLTEMMDEKTTTVMVRNLPRQCSQQLILEKLVETGFAGLWDFCYMPCIFSTGGSKGYCFINFTSHAALIAFAYKWHGKRFLGGSGLNVSRAEMQGREANVRKWDAPRMQRVRNPMLKPLVVLDNTREYDESMGEQQRLKHQ